MKIYGLFSGKELKTNKYTQAGGILFDTILDVAIGSLNTAASGSAKALTVLRKK